MLMFYYIDCKVFLQKANLKVIIRIKREVMIKIYLDQKDYINIAKGLLDNPDYRDDVESYEYLLSLVKDKKISIYYSWAHISETLKHKDVITKMLNTRCLVLDKLTEGNCLLQIQKIIKNEIQFHLLKEIKQKEIQDETLGNYPYGKNSDCIEFDMNFIRLNNNITESYKNEIKTKVNRKSLKELKKIVPNSNNFSKKDYIRFFTFDPKTIKKYFDSTLSFKNLILNYRNLFKFDDSNKLQLERANEMLEIMKEHQKWLQKGVSILENTESKKEKKELKAKLNKIINKRLLKYEQIIPNTYQHNIMPEIKHFLNTNDITPNKALNVLGNFECILGVKFYKDLLKEYFKSNSGLTRKLRKVDANDYFDIEHLRYLPYVDIYVTERYFSNIARNISERYDSKVFKNINELKTYLKTAI